MDNVPVPVCVPVPGTRMLSGWPMALLPLCVRRFPSFVAFIRRPYRLKFLVGYMLFSFLCVIESGTGTGQRPGHGHEFPPETAEPCKFSPAEPVV